MIRPFKQSGAVGRYFLLKRIAHLSFRSKSDGCMVVCLGCASCGKVYVEELQEARSKVIKGADFKCLACDKKGGRIRDIRSFKITFEIV